MFGCMYLFFPPLEKCMYFHYTITDKMQHYNLNHVVMVVQTIK